MNAGISNTHKLFRKRSYLFHFSQKKKEKMNK